MEDREASPPPLPCFAGDLLRRLKMLGASSVLPQRRGRAVRFHSGNVSLSLDEYSHAVILKLYSLTV